VTQPPPPPDPPDPREELAPEVDFGTPPPPPARHAEPVGRPLLRRSRTDKVMAGVCGGLGRYLGIDPVWVRIAMVALAIGWGTGFLLYIIGWIAIPEERPDDEVGLSPRASTYRTQVLVGGALVVVGAWVLIGRLFPDISNFLGPIVLIGFGVALLLGGRR
jgi:phage shock protein C